MRFPNATPAHPIPSNCRSYAQVALARPVQLISGGWDAWCRALFFHRRKDGSPLTLQQHHDEPGRLRVAGVAPHDVNIGGALVERLPCLERDGRLAFQLHDDLAFEHIDERMGVVPMDYVLCARRIRYLDYATLLPG